MLRTIVVPLDGSALADEATGPAASLARQHDVPVQLVAVHRSTGRSGRAAAPSRTRAPAAEADDTRLQELRATLERQRANLASQGLAVSTTLLEGAGPVGERLVHHLRGGRDDLVVLTSHGRGAVGRLWFGSVADHLVRQADPACLVLHTGGESRRPIPARFDTVFLPLDGSAQAGGIVDQALMMIAGRPDPVVVLSQAVIPLLWFGPARGPGDLEWTGGMVDERARWAERYLDGVAEQIRARGFRTETIVRVTPDPAGAILDAAADVKADVIGLALRRPPVGTRSLLGSVAGGVIHHARLPVLVAHTSAITIPGPPSGFPDTVAATS